MRGMNPATSGKVDFPALWQHVTSGVAHRPWSLHGPDHWRRVERNGRLLATRCDADVIVVRLFALFHDAKRENEGHDRGHGGRGAEYARELRRGWLPISDDQFELLHFACVWHTDADRHDDPTIGACWDADRLDLGRVGVIPSAEYMSTAFGREIAEHGTLFPWAEELRAFAEG